MKIRETPVFPNARRLKYFTFTRLAMGWVRLNWIVKKLEFQMVTTSSSTPFQHHSLNQRIMIMNVILYCYSQPNIITSNNSKHITIAACVDVDGVCKPSFLFCVILGAPQNVPVTLTWPLDRNILRIWIQEKLQPTDPNTIIFHKDIWKCWNSMENQTQRRYNGN